MIDMIILYSGTPGSGKSLHMARDLYYWLRSGHVAIANFEIDVSKIKGCRGQFFYCGNEQLDPDFLIEFSRRYFSNHKKREGAIRIYLDEVQLLFNARDWQRSGRNKWLSFFTQHRKYFFDVYLVAQFDRMIDRQIRSLIEYEFIHRKASNYGLIGSFTRIFAFGKPTFVCVKSWYPLKERIGSEWFTAHKKFYSIYDTFNTFDEFKTEKNKNVIPSSSNVLTDAH